MEVKTYIFQPEKKFLKQGYYAEDEAGNLVYECKMLTQPLIGAMDFEFVNHLNKTTTKHKVTHTVTTETTSFLPFANVKSSFKFNGVNIWDYLHEQDVRLETGAAGLKLGLSYTISYKGNPVAKVSTYSPNGENAIFTTNHYLKVETPVEYLDLAMLVAFAVSRTDQAILQ